MQSVEWTVKQMPMFLSLLEHLNFPLSLIYLIIQIKQGHHHYGDQAARRPHILCSICLHSFGALVKAERLFITLLHNQPMYQKNENVPY